MQVSTLLALMQDLGVDMLLLDLRDEEAYMQYHLKGGERSSCCWAPAQESGSLLSFCIAICWSRTVTSVSQAIVCCSCELPHPLVVPAVQPFHHRNPSIR